MRRANIAKMKNTILTIAASVIISAVVAVVAANCMAPKIYTADIRKIQESYYKMKDSDKELKAFLETANAKIAEMGKELEALSPQITATAEKIKAAPSAEARQKLEKEEGAPLLAKYRQKQAEIEKAKQEVKARMQNTARENLAEIRKDVADIVAKIAAEKKADYVLEKSGMFFGTDATDISEEVIARLNTK